MIYMKNLSLPELYIISELNNLRKKHNKYSLSLCNEEDLYDEFHERYHIYHKEKIDNGKTLNQTEIYSWVKNRCRYPVLNLLLKNTMNKLETPLNDDESFNKNYDFLLNNMDLLIKVLKEEQEIYSNFPELNQEKLTAVTKDEVDQYVCEILSEIDPTLEYLNRYKMLKITGRIMNLDEMTDEEKNHLKEELNDQLGIRKLPNNASLMIEDESCIFLTYEGTVQDIIVTIHEMFHNIIQSKQKNKISSSLEEFFPIFFEFYSLEFLQKKGYNPNEIMMMKCDRYKNVLSEISDIAHVCLYLNAYLKQNKIDENINMELAEEDLEILDIPNFKTPIEKSNYLCDTCIDILLKRPNIIQNGYSYIMGNYLAEHAIESMKNNTDILEIIKSYMNHISDIDDEEVFETITGDFKNISNGPKVYGKRKIENIKDA